MDDCAVTVSTEFEGANPQTAEGLTRLGPADFILFPTQEEDYPNYRFRMDTLVVNRASEPRSVTLRVDWRDPVYMEPRHHLFIKSIEHWERVPGEIVGTVVRVAFEAAPGETWVSLNPKYSYSDHLGDLERLRQRPEISVSSIGQSAQGRDIYLISVAPAGDSRPVVLVEAGNHPYETSGAYCIEGMLRWLLDAGRQWQSRVAAHFIQVSNPDGVAGGWCRLTGPGGVDICHELGLSSDPTCVSLRTFVERLRPRVYVNIHGWMYNDLDNFRYEDREAARFFLPCLLGDVGGRVWRWRIQNSRPEVPAVTNTWYYRERLGARTLGFDIAWNRRTEEEMRGLGASLLEAACEAAVGLPPRT
jgi:hypothetical protein